MPNPPQAHSTARARRGGRSEQQPPPHRPWTPLARALTVAGDSWTLAIAAELAPGPTRLSALRGRLAGVSAGLLDRYLQRMAAAGLITRSRFREMPPRVEIELTDSGRELLPVAAALGRWGVRRAWSGPREDERVDVEALLRQLALLLDLRPPLPDARIELALTEPGRERRWLLDLRAGISTPLNSAPGEEPTDAAATIAGDTGAWTRALGPELDSGGLELSGDRALARALLRAFASDGATPRRRR